ncbi:MAG: KH domain-containing protein [Gaiellaceae bacterium]
MEELLEYLAKRLVDKPDEVRVVRTERDGAVVLELHVAEDDVGKVIGRQGRIARALRTLVRASGGRRHERAVLEIVDGR